MPKRDTLMPGEGTMRDSLRWYHTEADGETSVPGFPSAEHVGASPRALVALHLELQEAIFSRA
jgi:hypothetical protein